MSLRLTCSTGDGSRYSNAGGRCSYGRSIGEDATTRSPENSALALHSSNSLGSRSVPMLLIDNNQNEDCVFGRPKMAESSSLWRSDANLVCHEPGAAGLKRGLRCSDFVPKASSSILSKPLSQTNASSVSAHPGGLEVYLL
jgi:hypothetical protein